MLRLPPQPAQVLTVLVARSGELVTRDELQKEVWKDDTIVDFELGLNRCIRHIRAILLDDASSPKYVETVPRVGYRFILPVKAIVGTGPKRFSPSVAAPKPTALRAVVEQPESQTSALPSLNPPKNDDSLPLVPGTTPAETVRSVPLMNPPVETPIAKHRTRIWLVAAGVIAGVMAVVWVYWLPSLNSTRKIFPSVGVVPLTSQPGLTTSPTFSPDGTQIAFAWDGPKQNNFDIYIKKIGSHETKRLTNYPDSDFNPVWSPDGRSIAFCRSGAAGSSAVWLISLLDGTERRLAEQWSVVPTSRFLTWSPDSKRLVFSGTATDEKVHGLLELDIATGSLRYLTRSEGGAIDLHPAYAPNGRWIAFARDIGRGISRMSLIPMKPEGGAKGSVVTLQWPGFESSEVGMPVWTPDSRELLFVSNRNSEHYLWKAKAETGSAPQMLAMLGAGIVDAALSSNGALAIVRERLDIDIFRLDIGRLRRGQSVAPEPVVNSNRVETNPRVSPDGSRIAFESNRSGPMEIWTANVDGSNLKQVTNWGHANTGSPAWSPDNSKLAFDSRAGGAPRIYVMPAEGGKADVLTATSEVSVVPAWSSDGAWIYFTSDRTGRPEIWRIPSKGGAAQQISRRGGFAAVSLGNRLWYSADRSKVTSLELLNLDTKQETTLARDVIRRSYVASKEGVYYLSPGEGIHYDLKFIPTPDQPAQILYRFPKLLADGLHASADGSYLYFGEAEQAGSDLLFVEDFWRR